MGLPIWAEKYFSLLCTEGGAISTRPDEDRQGWDFLVELPDKPHVGHLESLPAQRQAFVQVKSTTTSKRNIRIKLSTLHFAARSPSPWFIVLIVKRPQDSTPTIYGLHIWHQVIADILAQVRRSSLRNSPTNRVRHSLMLSDQNRISINAVRWMEECIGAVDGDYERLKHETYISSGYENGGGKINLTLDIEQPDEFERALLGFGNTISVRTATYLHSRFGVDDAEPTRMQNGRLTVAPKPVDLVEVRVRGPLDEPPLILPGQVFALTGPAFSNDARKLRFSAPPFEMIWNRAGAARLELSELRDHKHSVPFWIAYSKLTLWSHDLVNVRITKGGKEVISGCGLIAPSALHIDADRLLAVSCALARLLEICQTTELELSFSDIQLSASDLGFLYQLLSPRISIEMPGENFPDLKFKNVLYYFDGGVGPWRFGALIKRDVTEDTCDPSGRRIYCGDAKIMDAYLLIDSENSSADRLFGERLEAAVRSDSQLSLGDIRRMLPGSLSSTKHG